MKLPQRSRRNNLADQSLMTPLIDVVFQLLLFFLCASTGQLRERMLAADLPAGGIEAAAAPEPVEQLGTVRCRLERQNGELRIHVEGRMFNDVAECREFLAQLARAARDIPVLLDVAGDVPMEFVVGVYDGCRAAGLARINWVAHPPVE